MYGYGYNIDELYENETVKTLKERRHESSLRFANKNKESEKFGLKWFPKTDIGRNARQSTRRTYKEKFYKTERTRNNPIQFMIRQLNEQESSET